MPTYGYRCTACENEFERFQKMTDPPVTECESCGGAVKKMLYPVGIQFKGSGFYVNDYAKSGGSSKANGTAKESGETAKETTTSDSSATKSESTTAVPAASSSETKTPAATS
jgi:putative FmdB family regulatory protein